MMQRQRDGASLMELLAFQEKKDESLENRGKLAS
jgi:hypothetical protein